MALRQEELDKLSALDDRHRAALEAAEQLTRERNALVLELTDAGATRAVLAEALGVSRARVQQMVDAARRS